MSLSRRALLGLVVGLPFALKGAQAKPLSGVNRDRLLNGQWVGVSEDAADEPTFHWQRVVKTPEPVTFDGVPVLYSEQMDLWHG